MSVIWTGIVPYCDCYRSWAGARDPSLAMVGYCFVFVALLGWMMCLLLVLCFGEYSYFLLVAVVYLGY